MNTFSGKILRTGTQQGIVNLVAVLYDVDYVMSGNNIDVSHGNDRPNSPIPPYLEELLSNDGSDHPMLQWARQIILRLYAATDENEDGQWALTAPAGGRLGSALTAADGSFTIDYEPAAVNQGDQERYPELLLLVLAPDQSLSTTFSQSLSTLPSVIGTPEYQRIVHLSFFPLRNAAQREETVVQINPIQLERFGLATDTAPPTPDPNGVSAQFASAKEEKKALHRALRSGFREKLSRHQADEQSHQLLDQNLSALSRQARQSNYFLKRNDLNPIRLQSLLNRSIRDGILQIENQRVVGTNTQPQAFLNFDESLLAGLQPSLLPSEILDRLRLGQPLELEVDYDAYCAALYQKNGGTSLQRRTQTAQQRALRDQVVARIEALRNPPVEDGSQPPAEDPVSPQPVDPSLSAEEQVKALVLEQVSKLGPMTDHDGGGANEDQRKRISIALQELTPPVSPADATAFHDFTSLQIAFPDVWTEAFDGNVENIVKQLKIEYEAAYEAYREADGDVLDRLADFDERTVFELEEYTELLAALSGDIKALEQNPMPRQVRALFEDIASREDRPPANSNRQAQQLIEEKLAAFKNGLTMDLPEASAQPSLSTRPTANDLDQRWSGLSIEQQAELLTLATEYHSYPPDVPSQSNMSQLAAAFLDPERIKELEAEKLASLPKLMHEVSGIFTENEPQNNRSRRQAIRARVEAILNDPKGRSTRAQRLMAELGERLKAPHSFRIFAENSYNFGILTTHRQKWVPGDYQTGSLVSTITLAPGEKRKYSKKEHLKKSRNRKEVEKNSSTLSDERNYSNKLTSDIANRVNTTTNFSQGVSGSVNGSIGVFSMNAQSSSQFSRNQAVAADSKKQALHEATRKAAQELKNERTIEVSTEQTSEFESGFTNEISNPNNEITVSYLFYELERQYRVTEHLHKVNPVIMVAQHVPAPHEIDEDWLLVHEWVLRRVLLDRSFHEALDYVSEGLINDEVSLEVTREHFDTQKILVEELATTVAGLSELQGTLRESLIQTSEREKMAETYAQRAKKTRRRRIARRIFNPTDLIGRIADGRSSLAFGKYEDPELLEARREALETRLGYIDENLDIKKAELNRANAALASATEELTAALKESFTRRNLVNQLKLHVKENILYYMQAIWTHEYGQQRYMRLYNLPVHIPTPGRNPGRGEAPRTNLTMRPIPEAIRTGLYDTLRTGIASEVFAGVSLEWPTDDDGDVAYHNVQKRLHEIADLDNLLGFKGNYMIFPLKTCTFITNYMMQDYVDEYLGLRSPDPLADLSTEELLQYAEQIWHHESTTEAHRNALEQLILERLQTQRVDDELIVVPTGQLFIEALKGNHALLEDFKLTHRAMDVQKVQEEVRSAQLENLRKALRLLREEGALLDDPDVDKRIVVEGNPDLTISE